MCNMGLKLRFGELNFIEFVWKTETRERKLYLTLWISYEPHDPCRKSVRPLSVWILDFIKSCHLTFYEPSGMCLFVFCLFTFRMAFVYAVSRLKLGWCTFSFSPNFKNNADKTHAICFWSILLLWQREQTLQISTRAQHEHRMEDSFDDLHLRWKEHIVRIERREAKKKHHIV